MCGTLQDIPSWQTYVTMWTNVLYSMDFATNQHDNWHFLQRLSKAGLKLFNCCFGGCSFTSTCHKVTPNNVQIFLSKYRKKMFSQVLVIMPLYTVKVVWPMSQMCKCKALISLGCMTHACSVTIHIEKFFLWSWMIYCQSVLHCISASGQLSLYTFSWKYVVHPLTDTTICWHSSKLRQYILCLSEDLGSLNSQRVRRMMTVKVRWRRANIPRLT